IGPIVHRVRSQPVAFAMPGEKKGVDRAEPAGDDLPRRRPPWRVDVETACAFERLEAVHARTADDSENPFRHRGAACQSRYQSTNSTRPFSSGVFGEKP